MSIKPVCFLPFLFLLPVSAIPVRDGDSNRIAWTRENPNETELWVVNEGTPTAIHTPGSVIRGEPEISGSRIVWIEENGEQAQVRLWHDGESDILAKGRRGEFLDPTLGDYGVSWSQWMGEDWQVVCHREGGNQIYGEVGVDDIDPVVGETGIAWIGSRGLEVWVHTTIAAPTEPRRLPGHLPNRLWNRGDTLFWVTPETPVRTLWCYREGSAASLLEGDSALDVFVAEESIPSKEAIVDGSVPSEFEWNEIRVEGPRPGQRTTHASLAIDRGRFLVFGGEIFNPMLGDSDRVSSDTWILELKTKRFTEVISPQAPEPRCHVPLAFDPKRNLALLWGGAGYSAEKGFSFLNDTWFFDSIKNLWIPVETKTSPEPESDVGLVHDPEGDRFLMIRRGQLWEFQPEEKDWKKIETGPGPAPRTCASLLYDPVGRRLLLWGGALHPQYFDDTWLLDLETLSWKEIRTGPRPDARVRSGLGYDPIHHRAMAYGGVRGPYSERFQDLWSFDFQKERWVLLQTSNPHSPGRRGGFFGMPFMPELRGVLLFGGRSDMIGHHNDLWLLSPLD